MRCKACNKRFTDLELLIGDDLCRYCLNVTFGDTTAKEVITQDSDEDSTDE